MVDDLAEDGVIGGDEKRTSSEPKTARLATVSPAEVRKGT
jgi:hypothetical protein